MRPDVARPFDRMAAAARRDRIHLIVFSGYRSDAEQARLFDRRVIRVEFYGTRREALEAAGLRD